MTLAQLRARFARPEALDRMMPFWFWNDTLDDAEIVAQIAAFDTAGCGGFVIHPRLGLDPAIGYLTPRWFGFCRTACQAARARGLKVILYDEAMYPSGAAGGLVTRDYPAFRSRGLQRVAATFSGPQRCYWRAAAGEWPDDHLLAVRLTGPDEPRWLTPTADGLVRLALPAGEWQAEAFLDVPSGGHIRGVFSGSDDCDSGAPPSADLLNPAATARFIAVTHARYAAELGDYFGDTVIAFFTDEPSLLGRGPRRGGLQPWTGDLPDRFATRFGYDLLAQLPALFDSAPAGDCVRRDYQTLLAEQLNACFYQPLAQWCEAHGLALVGHPAESEDLASLETFTWPGQDMVWRYVEPGQPSAMTGRHSTAARVATSAKRVFGKDRAATELAGAYGWELSADEFKGLLDWHLARGNDLVMPHACYYSLAGARAHERPPDVGPGNTWWPWFRQFADYSARLSALLRVGTPWVRTAVACDPTQVPWEPAKVLMERQVDFDYVPADRPKLLARYAEVVHDVAEAGRATGRVLQATAPELRALRLDVDPLALWLLVNEGADDLVVPVVLPVHGSLELWDPLRGTMALHGAEPVADGLRFELRLERRQGLVAVVDPRGTPAAPAPAPAWRVVATLTDWRPETGDWCQQPQLETFAGTRSYVGGVTLPAGRYRLELGAVGEMAELWVDGECVGARLWSPYRFELALPNSGYHRVEIRVTNSSGNRWSGSLRPSGLLGPVTLAEPWHASAAGG